MDDNEKDKKVGVFIERCEIVKRGVLLHKPTCSIELVDSRTGVRIGPDATHATKNGPTWSKGWENPVWNETVIIDYNFSAVSNHANTHLLFLFDISDDTQEPPSLFKPKKNDSIRMRIAWAFLKPVPTNRDLNVSKSVRLQLFKLGKKCPVSHHTCPLFHLYSEHKRKKFQGSFYVAIKEVEMTNAMQESAPKSSIADVDTESPRVPSAAPVKIALSEWSRLPTQSCKLPNRKAASFHVSRRGCSALAFSPSGKLLACGSFANIIIIDVVQRREIARLTGHSGLIYEISWSAKVNMLLSVSADCSAMIWNTEPLNKTPLYVLPHPSFVYCGKWVTNGPRLLSGGKDQKIRYWGLGESGFEIIDELEGHTGFVSALSIAGDEAMFSGDSRGMMIMWILSKGKWEPAREFNLEHGCAVDSLLVHPARNRLAVASRTQGCVMLDIATGAIMHSYLAGSLNARNVSSLSPCGSLLFAFGPKNTIYAWEFETGRMLASYNSIFAEGDGELAGVVAYHPWDHLVAFAVLGDNYPVLLLGYSPRSDDAEKLGIHHYELAIDKPEIVASPLRNTVVIEKENVEKGSSIEDKLAAIVRNIDRVLAAKREMVSRVSSSYGPKRERSLE